MENKEKLKPHYQALKDRYDAWWGWEEGYTWEEGCDFFQEFTEDLFGLLDEALK